MFDASTTAAAADRLARDARKLARDELELTALVELMISAGMPRAAALEALGWSRATLYRRLAELREVQDYAETAAAEAEMLRAAADDLEETETLAAS